MKLKLAVVLLMLAAVALGFFIGRFQADSYVQHRHAEHEMTETEMREAVEQAMQTERSSSGVQAARDVRAIELIESGETQRAVQMLCQPIAEYYYSYAIDAGTDRERKLRAMIEQLVSTNKIVAAEITNRAQYYEIHGKIQ